MVYAQNVIPILPTLYKSKVKWDIQGKKASSAASQIIHISSAPLYTGYTGILGHFILANKAKKLIRLKDWETLLYIQAIFWSIW